jgi:hypothetical protein
VYAVVDASEAAVRRHRRTILRLMSARAPGPRRWSAPARRAPCDRRRPRLEQFMLTTRGGVRRRGALRAPRLRDRRTPPRRDPARRPAMIATSSSWSTGSDREPRLARRCGDVPACPTCAVRRRRPRAVVRRPRHCRREARRGRDPKVCGTQGLPTLLGGRAPGRRAWDHSDLRATQTPAWWMAHIPAALPGTWNWRI